MYKSVLLKISGELLKSEDSSFSYSKAMEYVEVIKDLRNRGVSVSIVMGGGNIFRGRDESSISRGERDKIGMLATTMNGIFIRDTLKDVGIDSILLDSLGSLGSDNKYSKHLGLESLNKGKVLLLSGGMGVPYFSTDTAAAVRAIDLEVDLILKATMVDGVYDKDPLEFKDAKKYDKIEYGKVIDLELGVMDMSSILLCREYKKKILIFNGANPKDIKKAIVDDENIGTYIY